MRLARPPSLLAALALLATFSAPSAHAAPEGRLTWAVHFSLEPTYLDPSHCSGVITPFIVLYALHDALAKPMPKQAIAPGLTESWTVSKDGLVDDFVLRKGVRFHNGEVMTAEDVKFSFERYKGLGAKLLKDRVAAVEIVDPNRIRFRLHRPWPDFMTFYATPATGAAWIVPKKYLEQVGEHGFKKAPVGAGPYKFVSFRPGAELVLEAHEQYWRKTPVVKTLVLRVVPDGYGSHPDIDGLFAEQVNEPDIHARAQTLVRIQQLVHERAMFIPLVEPVLINGVGPRVAVDGLNAITRFAYSASYEDLRITPK